MTTEQLGVLIAALTAFSGFLTSLIALIKALDTGGKVDAIHTATNSTNAALQANIATLTARQATPQELAARPGGPVAPPTPPTT